MSKLRLILAGAILLALMGGVLLLTKKNAVTPTNQLQVTASFYPLYYFASLIGGDKIQVINLTPAGAEPHDYEPTTQDILRIQNSKLLVLNGGVEAWANKVKQQLQDKSVTILETGDGLLTRDVVDEDGQDSIDPHIWLSPTLAKAMTKRIFEQLVRIDPSDETYYQANLDSLNSKLNQLDQDYREGLKNCQRKDIITSHAAFGYLAQDYNLTQMPIAGLSPDAEPSIQEFTQIADFARKNQVKYIFFEALVSPKLAQTLAQNIGASTLVLDPIEGISDTEIAQGQSYFTKMQSNLQNLRLALACQ